MTDLSTGVLKKEAVRMAPARQIGTAGAAGEPGAAGARARIVHQSRTHSIVEVVCACGRSIQVQCNYVQE